MYGWLLFLAAVIHGHDASSTGVPPRVSLRGKRALSTETLGNNTVGNNTSVEENATAIEKSVNDTEESSNNTVGNNTSVEENAAAIGKSVNDTEESSNNTVGNNTSVKEDAAAIGKSVNDTEESTDTTTTSNTTIEASKPAVKSKSSISGPFIVVIVLLVVALAIVIPASLHITKRLKKSDFAFKGITINNNKPPPSTSTGLGILNDAMMAASQDNRIGATGGTQPIAPKLRGKRGERISNNQTSGESGFQTGGTQPIAPKLRGKRGERISNSQTSGESGFQAPKRHVSVTVEGDPKPSRLNSITSRRMPDRQTSSAPLVRVRKDKGYTRAKSAVFGDTNAVDRSTGSNKEIDGRLEKSRKYTSGANSTVLAECVNSLSTIADEDDVNRRSRLDENGKPRRKTKKRVTVKEKLADDGYAELKRSRAVEKPPT